jgi:predicted nucleic acid-binding protein
MLLVVADTSPVRYLVQIGLIELLARLFEEIKLPSIVAEELRHPSAPAAVRAWIEDLPEWVKVLTAPESDDPILGKLDPGERAAIALGLSLKADLTLIDERKGTAAALTKGFEVTGTLGVLDLAATRGLVNLRDALDRLTRTNFRYRPELIAALLTKHRG